MTKTEKLSYISGILDGEGYFGLSKSSRKNKTEYRARIAIGINDKIGLIPIQEVFGGKIRVGTIKINHATKQEYSPAYILSFSSESKVREICESLLPYLRIKKEQAKVLLEFLQYKGFKRNNEVSPFFVAGKFNNLYIKCKKLKSKNWIIKK
jgi:hypothetical protein